MGESEEKAPQTTAAIERLKMLASEVYGIAAGRGAHPLSPQGTGQGDSNVAWAASLGYAQAGKAATDPASAAFVHQRISTLYGSLPMMVRMAANGLPGTDAELDRVRLAISYGGHPEFGESQEMLASIEGRRMIAARGFPNYWSQEQKEQVEKGMAAFMDRTIAESLALDPNKRREAYSKMGKSLGMLGGNCDILAMFCQAEVDRKGASAEKISELAAKQEQLVDCSRDMLALPSLGRSVRNIALAAAVGTAAAAAAPILGGHLMPYLQELALALPVLKGLALGVGKMTFGYGLATSCSAIAASVGSFMGIGFKAPSRLDAINEACAINDGMLHSIKSSLVRNDMNRLAAESADARLCGSFFNMSDEMLTADQQRGYVEALGYARSRLVGSILGGAPVEPSGLNESVGQNLRSMPASELALLGQITEPSIAAAFLLMSETSSQRLDLMMLQKRLDYLGSSEHRLDLGSKGLEEVRRLIIMRGEEGAASSMSSGDMADLAQRRIASLSPLGQRFARLCPRAQQAEFVARLVEKPLDKEHPDLDVAARLNESIKVGCARLERKSFFERKITSIASKATKSIIDDPVRALRALGEWAFSSKHEQCFDYPGQTAKLAALSGGMAVPSWVQRSTWANTKISIASQRFAEAQAARSAAAYEKALAHERQMGSQGAKLPPLDSGLGKIADKLRLAREAKEGSMGALAPRTAKA